MVNLDWRTKPVPVASLLLDTQNPRLSPRVTPSSQKDLIQYLFDHEQAIEVARSIARNGYFPTEPLLALPFGKSYVVVEGNRRLASLKALHVPQLLEGRAHNALLRLLKESGPSTYPDSVPVTIAPDRAATDRFIALRHVGTPVRRWQPENKATFILAKLSEGYDETSLQRMFGFTESDVRDAREIRAIADAVRATNLPENLREKANSPTPAVLTTIKRVFDSIPGRKALHVEPHGTDVYHVYTSPESFERALLRLAADVLSGKENSRTLNSGENIEGYFKRWPEKDKPPRETTAFAINRTKERQPPGSETPTPPKDKPRARRTNLYVLPKNLKVSFGAQRLLIIKDELSKLKRADFPNAGVVLLRVFFELMIRDYLERTQEMETIRGELKAKGRLPRHEQPEMRHLVKKVRQIAKERLEKSEAESVDRALSKGGWLEDMNAFVHQAREIPTPLDLLQFWERTQPLFRLMLEQPLPDDAEE